MVSDRDLPEVILAVPGNDVYSWNTVQIAFPIRCIRKTLAGFRLKVAHYQYRLLVNVSY
jgi:hypothetical protein